MTEDPHWPRAAGWLGRGHSGEFGLLGVPAHLTSISPTRADTTPEAVRKALQRYSTHADGIELSGLSAVDLGDIVDPDSDAGEERTRAAVRAFTGRLLVAVGGDNSITYAVAQGSGATGLITLDAHHDLRDGISNGSPVRRLIEDGLPGQAVVQIGIADFCNSAFYAARAREFGITVITRADVARRGIDDVMAEAFEIAGPRVHVDLDVDVCDRCVVPACPASAPGGLSAHELRQAARLAGAAPGVVSMDLTEVDAAADAPDGRTVRLAALCVLEAAAGLVTRRAT